VEASGSITVDDFDRISGLSDDYAEGEVDFRAANTDDPERVFHTFDEWECYNAGFYETKPPSGLTADNCRAMYRDFFADLNSFRVGLEIVIGEWENSCEHYLTNKAMNRIAWLGQAAMCAATGVPSEFRGGYQLLTGEQQAGADALALEYLNKWLSATGREVVTMADANPGRQSDIY